jgi:hypothetical protein
MRRVCCLSLFGLIGGFAGVAAAREIGVSPDPAGGPVLARAIEGAAPGDVIRVGKGVYRETVTIDKAVALVGEEGAVIDPSEPFRPTWEPAEALGKGVYRARVERRPRVLCLGGKVVAELDERRPETNLEGGPWYWKTLLRHGPPRSGFQHIRALWIYRRDEPALYAHLAQDADPAQEEWSCVWSTDALITFRGATDASVRQLTLAHGFDGVVLRDGARQCIVADCVIGPWDKHGIYFTSGATQCVAESNEVFRGAYEDWVPRDTSRERYEIWQIHKEAGFYDRVGIDLVRAGAGNRVHGNHVYQTFDGINVGDSSVERLTIPLLSPDDGRATEIDHNRIEDTRDSGIELGVGCIDVQVHDNILRRTHGGLRYKLPRIGPVFIYRNVLIDGSPFNIWYSMDASPAEGYVYHNTIIGGQAALAYGLQRPLDFAAPNWHYVNNLVIGPRGFFSAGRRRTPVDFTADYNTVVGDHKPYPDDPARDRHSHYVDDVPLEPGFPPRPRPGSAAIDAGLDLSTYFHGKPLPGCEPGYFRGKAPDAGALEVK